MTNETLHVEHNKEKNRYEVHVDGKLAVLEYRDGDGGGVRYFTHTGVPQALEGRGIASTLAKTALDEAQTAQLMIVPLCPFVRSYIQRHSEYQSLVKY